MAASKDPARLRGQADAGLVVALVLWMGGLLPGAQPLAPGAERSPCRFPVEATRAGSAVPEVVCGTRAGVGPPVRGAPRLLFGMPLDLNRAQAIALESLPGIGPRRAAAIAGERCRRRFDDLADLVRVTGIGPVTVQRLQGWAVARALPECPAASDAGLAPAGRGRGRSLDPREGGG
ncbi:MAG: helix-hairpin-helix domain-containing protein [Myxococcota bacterium]|nr:helix-hairpin-helix domain-containing protein [Myxococcota bacterium]